MNDLPNNNISKPSLFIKDEDIQFKRKKVELFEENTFYIPNKEIDVQETRVSEKLKKNRTVSKKKENPNINEDNLLGNNININDTLSKVKDCSLLIEYRKFLELSKFSFF